MNILILVILALFALAFCDDSKKGFNIVEKVMKINPSFKASHQAVVNFAKSVSGKQMKSLDQRALNFNGADDECNDAICSWLDAYVECDTMDPLEEAIDCIYSCVMIYGNCSQATTLDSSCSNYGLNQADCESGAEFDYDDDDDDYDDSTDDDFFTSSVCTDYCEYNTMEVFFAASDTCGDILIPWTYFDDADDSTNATTDDGNSFSYVNLMCAKNNEGEFCYEYFEDDTFDDDFNYTFDDDFNYTFDDDFNTTFDDDFNTTFDDDFNTTFDDDFNYTNDDFTFDDSTDDDSFFNCTLWDTDDTMSCSWYQSMECCAATLSLTSSPCFTSYMENVCGIDMTSYCTLGAFMDNTALTDTLEVDMYWDLDDEEVVQQVRSWIADSASVKEMAHVKSSDVAITQWSGSATRRASLLDQAAEMLRGKDVERELAASTTIAYSINIVSDDPTEMVNMINNQYSRGYFRGNFTQATGASFNLGGNSVSQQVFTANPLNLDPTFAPTVTPMPTPMPTPLPTPAPGDPTMMPTPLPTPAPGDPTMMPTPMPTTTMMPTTEAASGSTMNSMILIAVVMLSLLFMG